MGPLDWLLASRSDPKFHTATSPYQSEYRTIVRKAVAHLLHDHFSVGAPLIHIQDTFPGICVRERRATDKRPQNQWNLTRSAASRAAGTINVGDFRADHRSASREAASDAQLAAAACSLLTVIDSRRDLEARGP
jgi:hypothetical protein